MTENKKGSGDESDSNDESDTNNEFDYSNSEEKKTIHVIQNI